MDGEGEGSAESPRGGRQLAVCLLLAQSHTGAGGKVAFPAASKAAAFDICDVFSHHLYYFSVLISVNRSAGFQS